MKFLKENLLKIALLILILLVCFLFIQQNKILAEVSSLKESRSVAVFDDTISVEEYQGSVLQLGGEGSGFNQITAYIPSQDSYLQPSDNWVNVSFNRSADIMWVGCKDGYKTISCEFNGLNLEIVDDIRGCGCELNDKIKNTAVINCIKK